jgi:AcrR family transcriptional regulator
LAVPQTVIWMRPEHAEAGRPAERSRAQVTAAAITVADRDGLDAVTMRRVAAELGTGAASLCRYVATRDDLLDLMADSAGAEYVLAAPSGNWLADLLDVAGQARAIMLRHPWLPALVITRATLGPRGVDLLEHVLNVLKDHPADLAAKLEAFGTLMAVTATFVQRETATDQAAQQRQAVYLHHVAVAGQRPQLAALLATATPPAEPGGRFAKLLTRILTGLLATTPRVAALAGAKQEICDGRRLLPSSKCSLPMACD